MEVVLHTQELGDLALEQLRHGDAGPLGDDVGDVLRRHLLGEHLLVLLQVREPLLGARDFFFDVRGGAVLELGRFRVVRGPLGALDIGADRLELLPLLANLGDRGLLLLPVRAQRARLFLGMGELALELREALLAGGVGLFLERLALDLQARDRPLHLVELRRHRVDLHPELRRGLVDEVDGLVRQEAVGDVARRERRGRDQRGVLDADAVVDLVSLAQAAKY